MTIAERRVVREFEFDFGALTAFDRLDVSDPLGFVFVPQEDNSETLGRILRIDYQQASEGVWAGYVALVAIPVEGRDAELYRTRELRDTQVFATGLGAFLYRVDRRRYSRLHRVACFVDDCDGKLRYVSDGLEAWGCPEHIAELDGSYFDLEEERAVITTDAPG